MDNTFNRFRGDIYRYLSACFCLPQREMLIQESAIENLTSALEQVCPEAADYSIKMRKAMLEEKEESMTVEYTKLFVGPFELLAPPYGSYYLDRRKRVMGDSTMQVLEMYKKMNLSFDEDFKEMPDHVAVELEFMYFLIEKESQALDQSNLKLLLICTEIKEIFFNQFLLKWMPSFCRRIKDNTQSKFYDALADCALIYLENEKERFQADLKKNYLNLANKTESGFE